MPKLDLSSLLPQSELIAPETKEDFQRLEPVSQAMLDSVDEDHVPLEERVEVKMPLFVKQIRAITSKLPPVPDGIRMSDQVPRISASGRPVPPGASLPRLATATGSGLLAGATLNLVDLPDLPEESGTERLFRGVGHMIGATVPFGVTLKAGRALGLGRKGLAAAGATLGVTENRLLDGESTFSRDILAAGLTGAFMALAGPARGIAELERNFVARESSGLVAKYREFPKPAPGLPQNQIDYFRKISKSFNKKLLNDEEIDTMNRWKALHKHIPPGEIDFDDLQRVARDIRAGKRIGDDIAIAPIGTPRLAEMLKGAGLTKPELGAVFNMDASEFAARFGAVGRQVGQFKTGPFNRIIDLDKAPKAPRSPADFTAPPADDLSTATANNTQTVRNMRVRMEQALKGNKGASAAQQETREQRTINDVINEIRATPEISSARTAADIRAPQAAVETLRANAQKLPNASGGASQPLPGTVRIGSGRNEGRIITEAEALRKRGPVPRAAKDTDIFLREENIGNAGMFRTSVRYVDKAGKEAGRSVLVKLKPEAGGMRPINSTDVLPATGQDAEFLIETFSPAPGFSEAMIMDLRRRGAGLMRFDRPSIRNLGKRIGGRQITDDVLEFENIRSRRLRDFDEVKPRGTGKVKPPPVRGGAPSDDLLGIDEILEGVKPSKTPLPRGARVSSITPRQHIMADLEEAYRPVNPDGSLGDSILPLRTQMFDPIEAAKLTASKASTQIDDMSIQILGKHIPKKTRVDMMNYLAGSNAERAEALSRLNPDDIAKVDELRTKVFDPLSRLWHNGVGVDDLFDTILPRMREARLTSVRETFAGEAFSAGPGKLLRFTEINNSINPLEKDIARFTASYIRTGFHTQFVEGPLSEARKIVSHPGFPEQLRSFTETYLRGVDGTEGRFIENFGPRYKDMLAKIGVEVEPEEVKNVITGINALTHAGLLGFKPGALIRNATAGITVTAPRIGPRWFAEGTRQALTRKGQAIYRASGIADEQATILDQLNALAAPPISGTAQKVAKVALAPYAAADQIPRAQAYLGMRAKVLNTAEKLGARAPEREVLRKAGMYRFHPVHHQPFMRHWRAGRFEQAANEAGVIANQDTQWIYRQGFRPQLLASESGKLFGAFGIWPANYFEYMKQMTNVIQGKWSGVPRSEGVLWLGDWIMANTAVVSAFGAAASAVGMGPQALQHTLGWTGLSGVVFGGGPAVDIVTGLGGMVSELQRGAPGQMTGNVARTMDAFIPFQAAANDLSKALGRSTFSLGGLVDKQKGVLIKSKTRKPRSAAEAAFRFGTGIQRRKNETEGFFLK